MTDNKLSQETICASIGDTVFIVSPIVALVDQVNNFCASRNLNLWKGDPDSPDVIAVPYKIGIVDKYFMDPQFWSNWIEFLREAKEQSHEHLLIVILPPPFSEHALEQARKEFEDAHEAVSFVFGPDGNQVVQIMKDWLDSGSIYQPGVCSDAATPILQTKMDQANPLSFRKRLVELLDRFTLDATKNKVGVDVYFKDRIQAKWLLAKYLGKNHMYTKELDMMFAVDMDPFAVGGYLLAAKGILEALAEDLDSGLVEVKEES
jgi:hypothetical protein